jgi:pyridoxal phosphate enzyme (YggS family)
MASTENQSVEYTKDRQHELQDNIQGVEEDINKAYESIKQASSTPPRLVAVSKLKPASDIQALYDLGYRHFGENYIQELVDKSHVLPKDICWHFIGNLQSNKAKTVVSGVGDALWVIETLASEKTAGLLEKAVAARLGEDEIPVEKRLKVYIQVNTSKEDVKSGVDPLTAGSSTSDIAEHELVKLATYIYTQCPHLHLLGLMTIGSFSASHDPSKPNPDFETLTTSRQELYAYLSSHLDNAKSLLPKTEQEWELSMGMSADFESAIKQGSSGVRVGTRIFGERPKKAKVGDGAAVTK